MTSATHATAGESAPTISNCGVQRIVLYNSDVVRITGKHRVTIYRWVRAKLFPPKRVFCGPRAIGWLLTDVESWLNCNGKRVLWEQGATAMERMALLANRAEAIHGALTSAVPETLRKPQIGNKG